MKLKFEEIAYREYSIKGQKDRISVAIGKPQKLPNSSDFFCPYKLTAFNKEDIRNIFGIDGFQAIHLAFKTIDAELRRIIQKKSVELEWAGRSFSDLTFPE